MCIVNRLSKTEAEEYKRDLPEEFVGYRCVKRIHSNTAPLFQDPIHKNEPNTTKVGIHEAGDYSYCRIEIDYTPGFHVFKTEEGAEAYKEFLAALHYPDMVVTPVTVHKEWVQEIGNAKVTIRGRTKIIENHDVFVCDHIEVKEA